MREQFGSFDNLQVGPNRSNLAEALERFRNASVIGSTTEKWYPCQVPGQLNTGVPAAINRIYFVPFVAQTAMVVDRLAFNLTVVSAAGGVARMALFNAEQSGLFQPTTVFVTDSGQLVDSGNIAVDAATGTKSFAVGGNIQLQQGLLYWLAFRNDVALGTFRTFSSISGAGCIFGMTPDFNTSVIGWFFNQGSGGPFPNPLPTPSGYLLNNTFNPCLAVHLSSP